MPAVNQSKGVLMLFVVAVGFYLYEFILQAAPGVMQHEITLSLALNSTELGWLTGCFYLPYALLQIPAGLLLDRFATRTLMIVVILSFTLGTTIFALAPNLALACTGRLLMGASSAGAFITILHIITHQFAPRYFTPLVGLAETMGALGGIMSSALLACLLRLLSWRTVYLAGAGFGLCLAVFSYFTPSTALKHEPKRKNALRNKLAKILRSQVIWLIGGYSLFVWTPLIGLAFWGVLWLEAIYPSLPRTTIAQMVATIWLGQGGASLFWGWLVPDKKMVISLMKACTIVGAFIATGLIWLPLPPLVITIGIFAIGVASSAQALAFMLLPNYLSTSDLSTANGVNNMFIVYGGLIVSPLIGWGLTQNFFPQPVANFRVVLLLLPLSYLVAYFCAAKIRSISV